MLQTKHIIFIFLIVAVLLVLTACQGPRGDSGAIGATGQQGTPGADAPPATVVVFCPGETSYPNEFNEVGLLINGKIYGVYSLNDGFLTELPPGNYNSNAVGSSCDFTINADNTISH